MPDTLLRDLIDLPDHVGRGDFVLSLSSGVRDAEATLRDYVITPQLVKHFDEALNEIKSALNGKRSRGTYLDGSFGSGKSHFMAVLNFLLAGEKQARTRPELAPVVTKHDDWLEGKRFLMVPYHMIGADSLESAILGGYVNFVRERHADAPTPPVFRSTEWMQNARKLRADMGDEAFFARLNEGKASGDGDGWGELGSGSWNAESFDAAMEADPKDPDYLRLSSDVLDHFFPSIRKSGDFLPLDEGLAIMSEHASGLGYDALLLFLDELILWLASRANDLAFLSAEVPKVSKLVEAQNNLRPVPIVSFIARQRDLRDLVGEHVTGAQQLGFADQLKYWEGRFSQIRLEDANLPHIAEKRVLKAKSADARAQVDAEFERTAKTREAVMNVLLTRHSDKESFRKLYPFSPALVETLVAVSSLLQRERTALKIMMQLLVEQKNTLRLGELVPVGDLYDQVAEGEEAFSAEMKRHFQTADKLYRQQLRPMLEKEHDLTFEDAAKLDYRDAKREALRNDDRLIKTMLLGALAPEVESLKNLTAQRLAALNHGTIKSPIPGQEATLVLKKVRNWAGQCGQIKAPDEPSGPISIQLSSVDVDAILAKAAERDNFGNRVRLLKQKIFEMLGAEDGGNLWQEHGLRWRGTNRRFKIFFLNAREADDTALENEEEDWKLVIDYPIDPEHRGPQDDLARLDKFRDEKGSARTIVWVPSTLSQAAQEQLGTLVRLEHILSERQFPGYVQDLSPQDREQARSILKNMLSAQTTSLKAQLAVVYGLDPTDPRNAADRALSLDGEEHFQSLFPSLNLRVPGAPEFAGAMLELLDQALSCQYPRHPDFHNDLRITKGSVEKVLSVVTESLRSKERRVLVEKSDRSTVRQIANPLRLGEMGETHFVIGEHWKDTFLRHAAKDDAVDDMRVRQLREWMDQPEPMGLPPLLQDLLILTFAHQTNCSFTLHGGPAKAALGELKDEMRLKQESLPGEEEWTTAVELAQGVFGLANLPTFPSGQNLLIFQEKLKDAANQRKGDAKDLERILAERATDFGCADIASAPRYRAAKEANRLIRLIGRAEGTSLAQQLAAFKLDCPAEAVAVSMTHAREVANCLDSARLDVIEAAAEFAGERGRRCAEARDDLHSAFREHEYATRLKTTYERANQTCTQAALEIAREKQTDGSEASGETPESSEPETTQRESSRKCPVKRSQVPGDELPRGLSEEHASLMLTNVRVATTHEGDPVTLWVSRNLEALLKADPQHHYDTDKEMLNLPRFKWSVRVEARPPQE